MVRNKLLLVFTTALLAALLAGCNPFSQEQEPTPLPLNLPAGAVAGTGAPATYTVQRGAVSQAVTFPGAVNLAEQQDLMFEKDGRIVEVFVNGGSQVESGEPIASLDTVDVQYDLEAAKFGVKEAEEQLANVQTAQRYARLIRELELKAAQLRLDALKATESITSPAVAIQELAVQQAQLALDQLESGLDSRYQYDLNGARAQYNLESARIALRRAETALARTQLLAPIAGVARFDDILKKGKVVEAFTPVGTVVDPKSLVVESNLAPSDLERLQEGLAVTLLLGEAPTQHELPGVVARLPQPYGTGTRTVAEFMPTAAKDVNLLRPGIQVEIAADLARADDALWLPPDAILGFKDNYFVRLPDGSQVPVKVGIFGQDRVQILDGIAEGATVMGR